MSEWVKRLDRKLIHQGRIISLYEDTMQFGNGNIKKWDFIGHRGAAAVIPVLPDGRILLVRQFRSACDSELWEIPAGGRDSEEEDFLDCAVRELEEETGWRSEQPPELLITLYTTVAFCGERIDVFVARGLTKTEKNWDEDENLELQAFTLDELTDMVLTGRIVDGKTIAGLMAYRAALSKEQ
ncbi:MAG: NUDIX hydrolase [Lachnospiraceae bacterium]|nr:NUDIX hydrolase [Lachnospiraceae bacterium]MDY5741742.1 NUDIX hydrolase [Lachnospiraceae bacterium]